MEPEAGQSTEAGGTGDLFSRWAADLQKDSGGIGSGTQIAARTERAAVYWDMGRHREAIADYEEALKLDPRNAELSSLRRLLPIVGEMDKAIASLNKALDVDPRKFAALADRGDVHAVSKDYRKAIDDYTEFLKSSPGSAAVHLRRGDAYRSMDDYRKALEDYETAAQLEPRNASAHNSVAWLRRRLRRRRCATGPGPWRAPRRR